MQDMQQELVAVMNAPPTRRCTKPGCERKAKTRGLCTKHWMEAWRAGEVSSSDRKLCSIEACAKFAESRGLCATHYQQSRDAEAGEPCAIAGCERGVRVRGYCRLHYKQARTRGDIDAHEFHDCCVSSCTEKTRGRFCRPHHRRHKLYGLTPDEMNALDVGTSCEICGKRATDVDHSHKTGRVRGFLCSPCNMAIGLLRDDPSILRKAASYLERKQSENRTSNAASVPG